MTAWSVRILWIEIWPRTPPYVLRKSQKTEFRKIKNDKSVFSDISWPLTSFIFFFCAAFWNRFIALVKLFSLGRTVLAIPSKFGFGGWLIKVLKMVKTMLRMKTLVWYTDSPVVGRFRAQRPVQVVSLLDTGEILSAEHISFWLVLGVVFVYVVFKEFGSCGFSILFMYNISKLVYVMFMFSIAILTTDRTKRKTQNLHWPTHPPMESPSIMLMIRWKRC